MNDISDFIKTVSLYRVIKILLLNYPNISKNWNLMRNAENERGKCWVRNNQQHFTLLVSSPLMTDHLFWQILINHSVSLPWDPDSMKYFHCELWKYFGHKFSVDKLLSRCCYCLLALFFVNILLESEVWGGGGLLKRGK